MTLLLYFMLASSRDFPFLFAVIWSASSVDLAMNTANRSGNFYVEMLEIEL